MAAGRALCGLTLFVFWCLLLDTTSDNKLNNEVRNDEAIPRDRILWHSLSFSANLSTFVAYRYRKQRGRFYLHTKVLYTLKGSSTFQVSRLPLCGDVATNPGPSETIAAKFPCKDCGRTVRRNQDAILCAECKCWFHAKCLHLSKVHFRYYSNSEQNWVCGLCLLPKITAECYQQNSYGDAVEIVNENMFAENEIWTDFDEIVKNYGSNFKIAHINANSVGSFKFYEIKTWLLSGRLDLLVISESKIDASFPDSMFHVEGFRLCQSDRKAGGGGLMVYVRSDVCFVRVKQFKGLSSESLSNFRTESITLKVKIRKNWITVVGIYRPPSIPLSTWSHELSSLFEAASTLTNTVFYAGDFNADLLAPDKSPKDGRRLLDLLDIYDLY